MFFGGLKKMDHKNLISTKGERFTARTWFEVYTSTLLYQGLKNCFYSRGNFGVRSFSANPDYGLKPFAVQSLFP